MVRLLAIALLLAEPASPVLAVRVSPPISIAPPGVGCAEVLFTAEIRGPEEETWYCPAVSWTWPDGTTSSTESDCPPFETRHACVESQEGCGLRGWHLDSEGHAVEIRKDCPCTIIGYPRRWTRRVCIPPHPEGEGWEITVRLSARGKTVATQRATVYVK